MASSDSEHGAAPGGTEARICPHCRRPVPTNAPSGLCRHCLIGALLRGVPVQDPGAGNTGSWTFGDYELMEVLARGGMGVVYRARERRLNRIVALKMIRAGELASDLERKRFRAEAEAAAQLDHPNIVPIYEVGEFEGQDFFSMKLIEGGSLAEECSQRLVSGSGSESAADHAALETRNARLIATVARAVHYAHQRGVLHRDLKPGNILIGAGDEPFLTDFGLAKRVEGSLNLTLSGTVLGTPNYMPPEQAAGGAKGITTAADIYSLGAILYQLLTGQPPFTAETPLATMRAVMEQEPRRPSTIQRRVDRDLETICLKCLEKETGRRYASAQALAEDLERWQRHEPIHARPGGPWKIASKWFRRRPALASLLALGLATPIAIIFILLVMGANVTRERNNALRHEARATNALARAETETRRADSAATAIRHNLYAADMLLAQHALDDGNLGLARRLLEAQRPHPGEMDLRGFEWRHLWQRSRGDDLATLRGHTGAVQTVAFSCDGRLLASGDATGGVKIWDVASRTQTVGFAASAAGIQRLSFSGDRRHLSTADEQGVAKVWDLETGKVVWTHQGRNSIGVQLSSSRPWIGVSAGRPERGFTNGFARVVDWTDHRELLRVGPDADFERFSPDGTLAYCTRARPPGTEIWDVATRRKLRTFPEADGQVFLSPDGRNMASLEAGGHKLAFVDLEGATPTTWIHLGSSNLTDMAFSADGRTLAGSGMDQSVRLWDVTTRQEKARLLGHVDSVMGVAFSPDGRYLASAGADQTVKLWLTQPSAKSEPAFNGSLPFVLSPDGRKLACVDTPLAAPGILLHDLVTRETTRITRAGDGFLPGFFSAEGRVFFAHDGVVTNAILRLMRWDVTALTNPPQTTLLPMQPIRSNVQVAAAGDPRVCAVSQGGAAGISLWNPITGEVIHRVEDRSRLGAGSPRAFSPDGRKLASLLWPDGLRLTDLVALETRFGVELPRKESGMNGMAFSPDSQLLAVGCADHVVRLFDAETLRETGMLSGHQQAVHHVAFSRDGRTLASCGNGGVVKLWCWPARREVATILQSGPDFAFVAFTPDGNCLVAGGWGTPLRVVRVPPLEEIDALR